MKNKEYQKGKRAKLDAYRKLDIDCISVNRATLSKDLKSYLLISIKKLINDKKRHFENRNK
jgi:hypothetical protein